MGERRAVNAQVQSSILAGQPRNRSHGALGKSGLSRHSLNVESVSSNLTRPALGLKKIFGAVTQMARVLDCLSGSCGFKSRPFRQNFSFQGQ